MDKKIIQEFSQFMTEMNEEQDDLPSYHSCSDDDVDSDDVGGQISFDNLGHFESEPYRHQDEEEEVIDVNLFLRRSFGLLFSSQNDLLAMDMISDRMDEGNAWTSKFYSNGGLNYLLEKLIYNADDSGIQRKCLQMLVKLLRCEQQRVVDDLVRSDEIMKALNILLHSESDSVRFDTLHFLAYLVSTNEDALWFVLEVLSRIPGNDRVRFKSLIRETGQLDQPTKHVQISIMLFNQLIDNLEDIELKRYLIEELYDLGLTNLQEDIRQHYCDDETIIGQLDVLDDQINVNESYELDTPQPQYLLKIFNLIRIQLTTGQSYESIRGILRSILRAVCNNETRDTNLSLIASILNRTVDMNGTVQDIVKQQLVSKKEASRQSKQLDQAQINLGMKDQLLNQVKDIIQKDAPHLTQQSQEDLPTLLNLYAKHIEERKVEPVVVPASTTDVIEPQNHSSGLIPGLFIGGLLGASTVALWSYLRSRAS